MKVSSFYSLMHLSSMLRSRQKTIYNPDERVISQKADRNVTSVCFGRRGQGRSGVTIYHNDAKRQLIIVRDKHRVWASLNYLSLLGQYTGMIWAISTTTTIPIFCLK